MSWLRESVREFPTRADADLAWTCPLRWEYHAGNVNVRMGWRGRNRLGYVVAVVVREDPPPLQQHA